MNQNFYIAIEGGIGVGKTTLARLLQPLFKADLLLEKFEENPFLASFYGDRARYAFQTQLFFLLSRYHQQRQVTPTLTHGTLISDYTFAKDSLFAHLNLDGDELDMYKRVYAILDENIPPPDLIVYLRADTDVLMKRIAIRDRSYERDMDRDYIDRLRRTYERFFANYQATPLLVLDTNAIDFVHNPDDLTYVTGQVRSALGLLPRQAALLPDWPASLPAAPSLAEADRAILDQNHRRLADFQRWHMALDEEKKFLRDIYFNFICLTEEIGELGAVLACTWKAQTLGKENGHQAALGEELADCLAYLLKLANYAGIDLERAYLEKMQTNKSREWER